MNEVILKEFNVTCKSRAAEGSGEETIAILMLVDRVETFTDTLAEISEQLRAIRGLIYDRIR